MKLIWNFQRQLYPWEGTTDIFWSSTLVMFRLEFVPHILHVHDLHDLLDYFLDKILELSLYKIHITHCTFTIL